MEYLSKHITQDQIKKFLEKKGTTIWLTLADELCICYGQDAYNNPTNLPEYHTHNKGGVIVCFPNDISFGIISKDSTVGHRFIQYMQAHLQKTGIVTIMNNDLLYNRKKVVSYSCLPLTDGRFITTAHISVDMDLSLIKAICTKPMLMKIPGGLSQFGYKKEQLLELTKQFLVPLDPDTKINNGPIDICVMWVNPAAKRWQYQKNYWQNIEVKRGTQLKDNSASFGEARYRDWGIFKYWFRGVEKNCPWVNHVFLIVEDEDQLPPWLNKDNPKLIIKYHKDFIPNDCLPQYNGPAIEMWYSNIPELSENFIACDDDYFFYNPIPENLLFENNIPQTSFSKGTRLRNPLPPLVWQCILDNNAKFIQKYTGIDPEFAASHLPEARKKSFEAAIIKENYEVFHNAMLYSHFRSHKSYNAWVFVDLAKILGISNKKDVYKNSRYLSLNTSLTIPVLENLKSDMVCFNDIDGQFNISVQKHLINTLEKHFPEKSSFEL